MCVVLTSTKAPSAKCAWLSWSGIKSQCCPVVTLHVVIAVILRASGGSVSTIDTDLSMTPENRETEIYTFTFVKHLKIEQQ